MNIFKRMTEHLRQFRVAIWAKRNLNYNTKTNEFHFTDNQLRILKEYEEEHRIYKISRQSGKTTICKTELLYNACTVPNSIHFVFHPTISAAKHFKDSVFELLVNSQKTDLMIQNSQTKITLANRSEIYFLQNTSQFPRGFNIADRKRFVYCDDVRDLNVIVKFAETIQAKLLAFYT